MTWGYGGGMGSGTGWRHVALTWDHRLMVTYLDGRAIASLSIPAEDLSDFDPTFAVGCMISWYWSGYDHVTNHFHGTVDEVMLYRRVLSAAEIAVVLRGGGSVPAPGAR